MNDSAGMNENDLFEGGESKSSSQESGLCSTVSIYSIFVKTNSTPWVIFCCSDDGHWWKHGKSGRTFG